MKKILIIIIFITGCSYNKNKLNNDLVDIQFSDDLSLEDFKIKLEVFAQNSPFPNIDN